jgi:chemotaxis protein methyltransferase CheR
VSEALWSELQRLFHVWTGNRLRMPAQRAALEKLEDIARRRRMAADACLYAIERGELPAERDALVEGLVNRTTWFLRDVKGLHALVEQLQAQKKVEVNIWIAGCATGQEPYTLTMALLDAGLRPQLVATDISRDALRFAAEGRYRAHELARVPEAWKRTYFAAVAGDEMRVAPRVRDCIRFQHNNLAAGQPVLGGPWDAIVCRNVLLHFERAHAVSIVRTMNAATDLLLLSPVEQPLAWIAHSKRIDIDDVVLLRGERPPLPSAVKQSLRAPTETPAIKQAQPQRSPTQPPVVVTRGSADHIHDLMGRACQQLAQGALDVAIEICDAAIAADRLSPAPHLAKGLALKRASRFVEAVPVLRCARFLTNDEAWLAPYTLARCLERVGDRDGAIEAYRHALAIVDAGGTAGLSPWDPSMDAFARTVAESCRARLLVIRPGAITAGPITRSR